MILQSKLMDWFLHVGALSINGLTYLLQIKWNLKWCIIYGHYFKTIQDGGGGQKRPLTLQLLQT